MNHTASRVASSVIALACWQASDNASAQIDRATMIQAASSVVKVEAVSPDSKFQLGSGVVVGAGKVVTNCHVTRRAERVQVVRGDQRWVANAQAANVEKDICVLKVPGLRTPAVALGKASALKPAEDVVAVGFTGGVGLQLSDGDVVALHEWSGGSIVQSTNWFSSGASGGALFNGAGALVGILTFRQRGGAAHYFAAPADWVRDLVDDEARFRPIAPLDGQAYWELPATAQPYFLQASALEQTQQWPDLLKLAERWQQEHANDPEALYLQGLAQEGLNQTDASIKAYKASLELDAGYSRSWARLAQIYKRQGQLRDARQAVARLAVLDPKQANELAAQMETP